MRILRQELDDERFEFVRVDRAAVIASGQMQCLLQYNMDEIIRGQKKFG